MTEREYSKAFDLVSAGSYVCGALYLVNRLSNIDSEFTHFFHEKYVTFWDGLRYGAINTHLNKEESTQARLMLLTMFYVLGDENIYGEDDE